MTHECPFCVLPTSRIVWENELAIAIRDGYPVSEGHTLIIPRRHVATWFDATPWEQQALFQGVDAVKRELDAKLSPHGYNVGFNSGEAAGQTVMHLHIHVIPRFRGDMDDPRGGVRGVIPGKQKYDPTGPAATANDDPFASLAAFIPGENEAFGSVLKRAMRNADEIDVVAAFVQQTGVEVIEGDLIDAIGRGARIRLLTGDYLGVTHPYALQRLYTLASAAENLTVKLYETGNTRVFQLSVSNWGLSPSYPSACLLRTPIPRAARRTSALWARRAYGHAFTQSLRGCAGHQPGEPGLRCGLGALATAG